MMHYFSESLAVKHSDIEGIYTAYGFYLRLILIALHTQQQIMGSSVWLPVIVLSLFQGQDEDSPRPEFFAPLARYATEMLNQCKPRMTLAWLNFYWKVEIITLFYRKKN